MTTEEQIQYFDRAAEIYLRVAGDDRVARSQKSCLKLAAFAKLRALVLRMPSSVEKESATRIVNELDDEVADQLQNTGWFETVHNLYTEYKKEMKDV